MNKIKSSRWVLTTLLSFITLFSMFISAVGAAPLATLASPVTFTILHTNDFHGQLQVTPSDPNKVSTPGLARTARVINAIRAAKGASNVLLVDAGDEMQGSLLSNLGDGTPTGKGAPTIAAFNQLAYDVATFGNHEFDWGQTVLATRTAQATYPFVTANIVQNDTGNCSTANWGLPAFAAAPYTIKTITSGSDQVKVAFIGVTTLETPTITVASATANLCFKDPTASIEHYYSQMKADGADVIVVLSHLGYADGGYGYGIPVYGDQTLAKNLNTDGKPVNLIIGGHSHTSVAAPGTLVGSTLVVQAAYNGRRVGQADITVGTNGSVSISWKVTVWTQQNTSASPAIPASEWRTFTSSSAFTEDTDVSEDAGVAGVINTYASNTDYTNLVNTPVGYSAVDLPRSNTGDNMMATFVDDAIYNYLNNDDTTANDIDMFFNNAGGIRTDWCYVNSAWQASGCTATGTHDPGLLTYGNMFTILPFGNVTIVGKMTGAQILEVLNHGAQIATAASSPAGTVQPAGIKYKYFAYRDSNAGPQPYAWGAFDYCVINKTTKACDPLDMNKTYSVGTNEFMAPAGGDGYLGFKYMTDITYWGDMLVAVNSYVNKTYGTADTAYKGPNGDGTLDGRITRDGDNTSGSIKPITILHHNDSHGNLTKGAYVGYTQLATLIKQERLHNPTRTLLLDGGDAIQGDSMMYYFKSSYSGNAADGTPLPTALQLNPMIAVLNSMNYDAFDLGNHEFNYGNAVFTGIFKQATFPILGANVSDDGRYGLSQVGPGGQGVQPYIEKTLDGVKIAILGITNHRVPNYELPSNIVGLTFSNPIITGKQYGPQLKAQDDVVVALTHIGFTTNPKSVEVDDNVDTNFAAQVPGIDAIVGSHSHTNPASPEAPYKQLPTYVGGPNNVPVIINQAYRYNNTLGEIILGVRAKSGGGYEVVSSAGQYITVASTTTEDAATKAIVDPYVAQLNIYNNTNAGQTAAPLDTTNAYIAETNAANLQADAAVWELAKNGIDDVDFHLSGAMTRPSATSNWIMFPSATSSSPVQMKVSDMFTLMPYENSLVTLSMNGPQLKAVLERAYRNYYYYKYVSGYGGYSYYTTCMIDTNAGSKITYDDLYPAAYDASKNHVVSLQFTDKQGNIKEVDFNDANTFYKVSTVNYLAAGSCNFNDNGVSLWPLSKIVNDTQYYVRDAVIDYATAKGVIEPKVEGRLAFITDTAGPTITKTLGTPSYTSGSNTYVTTATSVTVNIADDIAGVASCSISVAGPAGTTTPACSSGDNVFTLSGKDGSYTITVNAADKAGNTSTFTETDILDTTAPTLTKTIATPKFVKGLVTYVTSHTSISVAADDGTGSGWASCTLTIDKGTANPYIADTKFTLPAPDGLHKLSVTCADHLGNAKTLNEADFVDDTPPVIFLTSPLPMPYQRPNSLIPVFLATDTFSGPVAVSGKIDGSLSVSSGKAIDLNTLSFGQHTLVVTAVDKLGNQAAKSVTFSVSVTLPGMTDSVNRFAAAGKILNKGICIYIHGYPPTCLKSILLNDLSSAQIALKTGNKKAAVAFLNQFIKDVQNGGTLIKADAAAVLIDDANWVIGTLK